MFRSARRAPGKGDPRYRSDRNRFQGEYETILIISRNLAGCTFILIKTMRRKLFASLFVSIKSIFFHYSGPQKRCQAIYSHADYFLSEAQVTRQMR